MTQRHLSCWFLFMSTISNYQIEMQFSLTFRKIDVDYLSIFKLVFFVVYNFKLLTKIRKSTKKSEYDCVLTFSPSIVKLKHVSYTIFKFSFDIVDNNWDKIFNLNFCHFFAFVYKTQYFKYFDDVLSIVNFWNIRWIYVEFSVFLFRKM